MDERKTKMSNKLVMILLLGLLLMAITAPFSALALLMVVLFASAFFWTLWTMVRIVIRGEASERD